MLSGNRSSTVDTRTRVQRNRKPVSCNPCRQKKLKCDRALPACSSCLARSDISSCIYQYRRPGTQRQWPLSHTSSTNPHARIDKLESLFRNVIENRSKQDGVHRLPNLSRSCGTSSQSALNHDMDMSSTTSPWNEHVFHDDVLRIQDDSKYESSIDGAHWDSLLGRLSEVRIHMQRRQQHYQEQSLHINRIMRSSPQSLQSSLILGSLEFGDKATILSKMPSRQLCDLLVSRYFGCLEPALYIIHVSTFYQQYQAFWGRPHDTPTAWIALLIAMLRIAVIFWQRESFMLPEFDGHCSEMASEYRSLTVSALTIADWTSTQPHMIEALVLHLFAEYASVADFNLGVWILLASIIRLAMRMGYHLNRHPHRKIPVFEAEMQRRVWTYLGIADIMFSFQSGLRSMIKLEDIKANLPSNIHDDHDFHEHIQSLPPALPSTVITSISFLITKAKLAIEFAATLQELSKGKEMPYDRVLEIDQDLRKCYDNIAEHYKLHTISYSDAVPLTLIMSRYMLANLHYKSICILHSRYLGLSRHNPLYLYSRRSCLEASMQLLSFQAIQHEHSVAHGSIHNLNKFQTSLTTHDFLLAASLISIALSLDLDTGSPFEGRSGTGPSRRELIMAIERSVHVWIYLRDRSAEAFMAADVLSMLLMKFRKEEVVRPTSLGVRVEQTASLEGPEEILKQSKWWHKDTSDAGDVSAPMNPAHYAAFDYMEISASSRDTTTTVPEGSATLRAQAPVKTPGAYEQSSIGCSVPQVEWTLSPVEPSGSAMQTQDYWSPYFDSLDFSDPFSAMLSLGDGSKAQ